MPPMVTLLNARLTRRTSSAAIAATAGVAALRAGAGPGLAALAAAPPASASAAAAGGAMALLAPDAQPYDLATRRDLALDALTFLVALYGRFPGRTTFQLPVAPWFGGYADPSPRQDWSVTVPAGVPIYLLADADDAGSLDASRTSVLVDGAPLGGLGSHVHGGVSALSYGRVRDFAVLGLVFAPPPAGRYHVEVRTRRPAPPVSDGAAATAATRAPLETLLVYDVAVQDPDSIGPAFYREPGTDACYAMVGNERRLVPDAETLRILSAGQPVLAAGPAFLRATPEGTALPVLRDGMQVQADDGFTYQIRDGRRVWVRDAAGATGAGQVEAPVVYSIRPQLQDGMLIRSTLPDVFHVDRASLRKIPDWTWASEHGLDQGQQHYVPSWMVPQLPQNSPEWVMPGGSFVDRSFYSEALGRAMPYRVYVPAGYDRPEAAGRRYPVIYLLHGLSGRYDEWSGYGAEIVANSLVAEGTFGDAVLVAPQGGFGYWMNQEGGARWADYVAKDLVSHIDQTYRTIPKREARAIGGLSMGAHGAMQIALNFPTVFGIVGAHSPSIRDAGSAPAYFGGEAGMLTRDPIALIRRSTLANPPLMWLDAGDQDVWRSSAESLHRALLDKGWTHEWHVYAGEHDGWYWGEHLWDYLRFYWAAFQRGGIQVTSTRA